MAKRLMAVSLVVVMLFSVVVLVGCGGSRTAADWLNAHDQAMLDGLVDATRAAGMDLEMTTDGDVMIYTYTFMEQLDEEMSAVMVEMFEPINRATSDALLAEMSDFGVANPVVRYIYLNADGSLLGEMEFSL